MLTLAVTADLHWGIRSSGDAATRRLSEDLRREPPDILILAGDVGAGEDFPRCLEHFATIPCRKALVPGNHDIWVTEDDGRGDSWTVYRDWLPRISAAYGFHYLDGGPMILTEHDLAIVGTMNWYDGSWADAENWDPPDDFSERLRDMRFSRGRHNDARFVRWHLTHAQFTQLAVATLESHLRAALGEVSHAVVVTHYPAFRGLNFPGHGPITLDRMLWQAFSGNRSFEELLERFADRIAVVFSGHTHRARHGKLGRIEGYNIGGDYEWKRLLRFTWPDKSVEPREFYA
ncbi:MAG: metallophosphoesterase [Gemmataceae bacterium]|nr:metallophosphoesterase [Gemmataceae bacterium]